MRLRSSKPAIVVRFANMFVALRVPADNSRTPLFMEQALSAIHRVNTNKLPIQLLFASQAGSVGLFVQFPQRLKSLVESQLFAQYPDAALDHLAADALSPPEDWQGWTSEVWLAPDVFPIRRYGQFEEGLERVLADPVASLLSTVSAEPELRAQIELLIQPAGPSRRARAKTCLARLARPAFSNHPRLAHYYAYGLLSPSRCARMLARLLALWARPQEKSSSDAMKYSTSRAHEREEDLQAATDKLGRHLFEARLRLTVFAPQERALGAKTKLQELAGAVGQFSWPRLATFQPSSVRPHRRGRAPARLPMFLLSAEEVASLWHPPTAAVQTATMARVESRQFEPPVVLPSTEQFPDLPVLGITSFRDRRQQFGLLPDDRRRHLAIVGKTGTGKSTLLENLIRADVAAGRGVALVDPHGDLADSILAHVPRQRTNDVVLLDAADQAFPVSFSLLSDCAASQRPLVVSGVVSAFKKIFGESWGPRLEHILRNALLTLMELPGASLLTLLWVLYQPKPQFSIAAKISDPVVRMFWEREYGTWPERYRAEAVAPVLNKLGHFLSNPLLRAVLGQSHSTIDLRRIMDERQVLVVNLSKGRMGEDASALLGALVITGIQLAAMSRADVPERERPDFYCYIDEFQNFATESFATILAEARKYRLNLVLANQYLAQVEEQTLSALFGNAGSLITFQVGHDDALVLADQLAGSVTPGDLLALPRYHAYARLLIEGMPSRPFSFATLPPAAADTDRQSPEVIRRTSRHRYARPAAIIEREFLAAYR